MDFENFLKREDGEPIHLNRIKAMKINLKEWLHRFYNAWDLSCSDLLEKEGAEAYIEIKKTIDDKPIVTKKWAEECWNEILEHWIDCGFRGEGIFIQRLKEAGVIVVETKEE